jgi:Acyltransferase family
MRRSAQGSRADVVAPEPDRDRFIDLVRVTSMVVVVVLHWLSVMPALTDGKIVDRNVVSVIPGLWPLTWAGDVMALFCFAGGYANWVSLTSSLRRGESYVSYLARRARRLLRPTFNFLGAWLAVDLLMRAVGRGSWSPLRHVVIGNTIPFGPLRFLGVYLLRARRRQRLRQSLQRDEGWSHPVHPPARASGHAGDRDLPCVRGAADAQSGGRRSIGAEPGVPLPSLKGRPLLGVANADQLFAASSNWASQLVVMAGHDHMDTYTHNPSQYMTVLLSFIDRQLGQT